MSAPIAAIRGSFFSPAVVERAESERRGTNAALVRSEAYVRSMLEGMAEGVLLLGWDWRIADINPEGLRIDGRPREAILGRIC